ncbi:MAG: hypothetical protein OIN86_09635 [Candidatus Methanoperedens sp.]|nr:hypothetical protein [Candidatus Methanoperedens sp.]CAG0981089.1 hypothetical protein METP1_01779 [Methanosarcinales archaeon]
MPTASAFSQARKKIKPELFIALKDETVKFFYKNYEKSGLVKRWGIETFFDRLKNLLEIERFSSKTMIGIEQDFYGLIFFSTFESVLTKEDEEELSKQND